MNLNLPSPPESGGDVRTLWRQVADLIEYCRALESELRTLTNRLDDEARRPDWGDAASESRWL